MKQKTLLFKHLPKASWRQRFGMAAFTALTFLTLDANAQDRTVLKDSLAPIDRAGVVDDAATATELNQTVNFMVSLRMRNFAELESRVTRGNSVPQAEMADKYYPLENDYQNVQSWLTSQGLTVKEMGGPRLGLFVSGTASQVATAFQVQFAIRHTKKSDYLTITNAPTVPSSLAPAILGVSGLQSEDQPHSTDNPAPPYITAPISTEPQPQTNGQPPFKPSDIYKAYNGANLPNQGSGQTIAIVGTNIPLSTDLSQFWANTQTNQSLNNIQYVNVGSGNQTADATESTLDVEWASSMAPACQVRFYHCLNYNYSNIFAAYQQIINEINAGSQPNIHQVSLSFAAIESSSAQSTATSESQYLTTIASEAQGVTVFAASGDGGSNPPNGTASTPSVEIPASIPAVTGVGGTSLQINASTGLSQNESAWSGSGGGISKFFARPSYQVGINVPTDNKRHVPDVAMVADPNTGGYLYLNGVGSQIGGTSLSTPILAAITARVNEARTSFGVHPFGYNANGVTVPTFNAYLYPLIEKAPLRDIDSGSNGAYNAGAAYNQVTGCGVPRIASLFHSTSMPFFQNEVELTGGYYYLQLPNGNPFGYYDYTNFPSIYHVDLGFESVSTTTDSNNGVYFYDFTTGHEFYTSYTEPFPYLFDFTLNATLYYYPQSGNPGYYTTNPRYFYNTVTGKIITQ